MARYETAVNTLMELVRRNMSKMMKIQHPNVDRKALKLDVEMLLCDDIKGLRVLWASVESKYKTETK